MSNWATKYGIYPELSGSPNDPTSLNFGGSCKERVWNMKKRGYGQYGNSEHPEWGWKYWEENCSRLIAQKKELEAKKAKDEELRKKLEADKIAREKKEAEMLAYVAEVQRLAEENKKNLERLAEMEKEQLRIELEEEKSKSKTVKPEIVATSGLVPLGILGILLLYSSGGKS